MTIEQRLCEALQSKSHQFTVGMNVCHLEFVKTEDGSIKDVLFRITGANSMPKPSVDCDCGVFQNGTNHKKGEVKI